MTIYQVQEKNSAKLIREDNLGGYYPGTWVVLYETDLPERAESLMRVLSNTEELRIVTITKTTYAE